MRVWWRGARPRTLGAAIVPVIVGTAAAGQAIAWRTVAALVVALGLQVGVNYANDVADHSRGVDTPERAGPARITATGLASPRAVVAAAGMSFAVAAGAGLALALAVQPWLLTIGAASILAAVLYSGGPRPYAGLGLGEVAVFAFFGLVAVCGTAYVQVEAVPAAAWWSAVMVGLLAVAILVANNLRDIPTDAAAGKRTLAVRLGERGTRVLYAAVVAGAFAAVLGGVAAGGLPTASLLALLALPLAALGARLIATRRGRGLIAGLQATAGAQLAAGLFLALGLWLG